MNYEAVLFYKQMEQGEKTPQHPGDIGKSTSVEAMAPTKTESVCLNMGFLL